MAIQPGYLTRDDDSRAHKDNGKLDDGGDQAMANLLGYKIFYKDLLDQRNRIQKYGVKEKKGMK